MPNLKISLWIILNLSFPISSYAENRAYTPLFFTDDAFFDQQALIPLEKPIKAPKNSKTKISIIVDDLGHNSIIAKKIIQLPAPLTLAILPHTPFAKFISKLGTTQDHEIIMHLPMEATSRPDLLGPGALFSDMKQANFQQTFLDSAQSIPNLIGFNNHMGSLLTQNNEKMGWLMAMAKDKGWYFLDSKTTEDSIALDIANKAGIANIGRDVFLDHFVKREDLTLNLQKQFNKLKQISKLRGHVVVICHPYPETFEFLSKKIPELVEDFELVHLSELVEQPKITVALKD